MLLGLHYLFAEWASLVRVPAGAGNFSPPRPHRLWDPHRLLSNVYQRLFHGGKAAGAWNWPLTKI